MVALSLLLTMMSLLCYIATWQKLRNEEIRSTFNQEETLYKRIQQQGLTWFDCVYTVERMDDNRISHRVLRSYIIHYRQQKQRIKAMRKMNG